MLIEPVTVNLIKKALNKAGRIDLPAEGNSMYPFIKKGDMCRFLLCEPALLKRGDIALYHSSAKQLVAHRFSHSVMSDQQELFYFKGDTNLGFDEPVPLEKIIGKLTVIQKGGKGKNVNDLSSLIWGRLVLAMPVIPGLLRYHLNNTNKCG